MNEIKNPLDSLQSYFDELMSSDDLLPAQSGQENYRPIAQAPEPAIVNIKKTKRLEVQAKPKLKTKAILQEHFAEPSVEQKAKLQKLLSSAQPELIAKTIVAQAPIEVVTPAPIKEEIQDWDISVTASVAVESIVVVPEVVSEVVESPTQIAGVEWLPNGLPLWAQSRFDVLLFKVSGLTLAVPLISLGQIQPITDELTPLFGQIDWFMGLQPTPQGKIRTVNTAKFVMPERYDDAFLASAKYVVSINGVHWGLAVDSVNQPISLLPEDVKWRRDRSKRPWLAGTVKEHMCALLDIPAIAQMLMRADKNALKNHS